ncbi:MAG TPA: creatininase family protein [bacterium]|nr:creatininase family protein [bacterium]
MDRPGVLLEQLTWPEAEPRLKADPVVVLPVGSAAKEHGPHLPLGTDRLVADYLASRLADQAPVIVLPTLTYGYYPHFTEFPGSTHVDAATFGALARAVILSVHRHGPRRFLVLNTGISTAPVLEIVARDLNHDYGLLVGVTRIEALGGRQLASLLSQPAGTHADEYETSLLLAIAPDAVRMERAARDIPSRLALPGVFVATTLHRTSQPNSSGTGVYGDATLATREKGERIVAALVDALVAAAQALQAQALERRDS